MKNKAKKIAARNARAYSIFHPNWGLTVHFSAVKKNGRRTVTTILD